MLVHPVVARPIVSAGPSSLADQLIAATGTKIKALYEFTDFANMFQNTGGSTAVTAASDPVRYWTDLSGNGNHATASVTNSPGNAIAQVGYIQMNDSGFMITGTMSGATSGMEIYALIDRNTDNAWNLLGKNGSNGHGAGLTLAGEGSSTYVGFSGTITDFVDNAAVSPQTRAQSYAAMTAVSGYRVQCVRGLTLTSESGLIILGFNTVGYRLAGNVKCAFICEGLTTGEQTSVDTILDAAK